jgi:hypothetical protein
MIESKHQGQSHFVFLFNKLLNDSDPDVSFGTGGATQYYISMLDAVKLKRGKIRAI